MRKLYTMVFSMILVMGLAFNSIAQDQGDAAAKLTYGKWINHTDGYIPNPIPVIRMKLKLSWNQDRIPDFIAPAHTVR